MPVFIWTGGVMGIVILHGLSDPLTRSGSDNILFPAIGHHCYA